MKFLVAKEIRPRFSRDVLPLDAQATTRAMELTRVLILSPVLMEEIPKIRLHG